MANKKITALSALTSPASGDLLAVVDVSDTTEAASGTTKKIAVSDLVTGAPPADHAVEHQNGGGDEINVAGLSGVLADPQVADKVKESSGPTTLTVGALADGEFLKRSGSTIVSDAVAVGPATQVQETSGPTVLDIGDIADGEFLKRVGSEIVSDPGGAGTPGGASGDIQYNNAGSFGAAPLIREDADTVGLYDTSNAGENPSRLNIYGLKNGATFERLSIYYNTADDRYVLDVNHNGGTLRDLQIRMNGTPVWQLEDTGAITAASSTASVMRVGDGTSSAPGLQFSTSPTGNSIGFTASSGPFVNTITNAAKRLAVHDFGAMIGSGGRFGWASTSLESGTTEDVALERGAAGRVDVVDASVSHNPRDLKLRACLHNADTFANRPGSPVKGMVICVTDSTVNTFGATVAGGGANSVLAWYNGTNWTVIGT